jgi:hypothetical protein
MSDNKYSKHCMQTVCTDCSRAERISRCLGHNLSLWLRGEQIVYGCHCGYVKAEGVNSGRLLRGVGPRDRLCCLVSEALDDIELPLGFGRD